MNLKYFLEYLLAKGIVFVFGWLPAGKAAWCIRRIADVCFFCLRGRRAVTFDNIERAYPEALSKKEKKRLVRKSFQNVALSLWELLTVEKTKKQVAEAFNLEGNEHLEKAFARGKGVVLIIAHFGSWEYLAFLPFLTKREWSVVVKAIKNPYINRVVEAKRRVMTVNPIFKKGAIKPVFKELKNNHGVAILIDQWDGADGIWTEFFAHPTSTTSVPARLAHQTGCALVPAYCLRVFPGKYKIVIQPEVPFDPQADRWEEEITQKLNRILEKNILSRPEQWMWEHRRWKPKPKNNRIPEIRKAASC
ncbi:MAG: lysophospholipid acyltransferase family protein [Candidatus Omnitrophica bacterium]|nr:lysophospholipid acyltransferase family protein [Candidatus Omnitrophota bacterium]